MIYFIKRQCNRSSWQHHQAVIDERRERETRWGRGKMIEMASGCGLRIEKAITLRFIKFLDLVHFWFSNNQSSIHRTLLHENRSLAINERISYLGQGKYQAQVQTHCLCAACNHGGKSRFASVVAATSSIALLHLLHLRNLTPSLSSVFFSAS